MYGCISIGTPAIPPPTHPCPGQPEGEALGPREVLGASCVVDDLGAEGGRRVGPAAAPAGPRQPVLAGALRGGPHRVSTEFLTIFFFLFSHWTEVTVATMRIYGNNSQEQKMTELTWKLKSIPSKVR